MSIQDLSCGSIQSLRRSGSTVCGDVTDDGRSRSGRVGGFESGRVERRESGDCGSWSSSVIGRCFDEEFSTVEVLFRESNGDGDIGFAREIEVCETERRA